MEGAAIHYRELSLAEAVRLAGEGEAISSCSEPIDELLEGGYRTGQVVEFYGASNTGKTLLALLAAFSVASRGGTVAFVDTEATFRPERLSKLAETRSVNSQEILDRIFCIRAEDTHQQMDAIGLMKEERVKGSKLVVVDTVTKNFTLEFGGMKRTPTRQSILDVYMNRLVREAYLNRRAVLLTNRATFPPGDDQAEGRVIDIGGVTLGKYVSRAVQLRRVGQGITAALTKTHMGVQREVRSVSGTITDSGFERSP